MVSVSAKCRPLFRPSSLTIVGRYVDHHSADISIDTSVDTSTDTSRSIYRPTLADMLTDISVVSTDTSVECRSICRPRCRPIYWSRGAQNTHDHFTITNGTEWSPIQNCMTCNVGVWFQLVFTDLVGQCDFLLSIDHDQYNFPQK